MRLTARSTIIASALAIAAIAAPAASARFDLGTPPPSWTPQEQTVPVEPPILPPAKPSQFAAIERAKEQALANHAPPNGRYSSADTNAYATPTQPNPATPSGSGFDASDAAIGAAIAAVIVLLITASTLAVRQRRQPHHP